MSQQIINIGTGPNALNGDPLRSAFNIINQNFSELYSTVSGISSSVTSVSGRTGNVTLTTQDIIGLSLYQIVSVPTSSKGSANNKLGYIAFNNTYMYYCTADYTDGVADIWKRISWSADTW